MNMRSDVTVALPSEDDILDTADVFGLLADPGRLRILVVLRGGEANVGQLSQNCGLSESATSHALRLLRAHQVVRVRREGRLAYYELADSHVADLIDIALAHIEHSELEHPEHERRGFTHRPRR
jgi:ArsR family transcriptional regulator, lead/cadmium/zinc/bismuth-responsive transcriptional repressor